jgi:hypothetical protein
VEEGFGGFIRESSSKGTIEEEGCVFVGSVFGTEDEDSYQIETRFICADKNTVCN